jgi:hypothetical protein
MDGCENHLIAFSQFFTTGVDNLAALLRVSMNVIAHNFEGHFWDFWFFKSFI